MAVNDIDETKMGDTLKLLQKVGAEGMGVKADVASSQEVKGMFSRVVDRFGTLDILVNNAGTLDISDRVNENFIKTLEQVQTTMVSKVSLEATRYMTDECWDRLLRIHLNGTFYCTREALKIMEEKGSGKIINVASQAGIAGLSTSPHYSAAKGAIIGFTKSVAHEVIGRGIQVNAIAPGFVDTPLLDILIPELRQYLITLTPMGRFGRPDEIAPLAVFLASDESSFFVGQVIGPDGGIIA